MKAVVQRVKSAGVSVRGEEIAKVGNGLLVLLGVAEGDTEEKTRKLARKVASLRIIADKNGKMNLSVRDVGGEVLVVSQFTLLADVSRGHRPSFVKAAPPEAAERLYELFAAELRSLGVPVKTGKFGAYMQVFLVNDGPVTIIVSS